MVRPHPQVLAFEVLAGHLGPLVVWVPGVVHIIGPETEPQVLAKFMASVTYQLEWIVPLLV